MTVPVSAILRALAGEGRVRWAQDSALDAVREVLAELCGPELAEEAVALARERMERRRAEATRRGSAVHRALARALRGEPHDLALASYVRAARAFLADFGLKVVAVERRLESRLGFLGVVDLLASDGNGLALVDWKTGMMRRDQALQLGAYALAAEEAGLAASMAYLVGVRPDGYEAMGIDLSAAKRGLLGALDVYRASRAILFSIQRQV